MPIESESVFEFPCRFPIKAMGRDAEGFPAHVMELVAASAGPIDHDDVRIKPSRDGRYISVTITFTATSQEQLDTIYKSLTGSERILVVL
ncbi:MAG: YbeD family protein [Gammaproteobacteria bacterium]